MSGKPTFDDAGISAAARMGIMVYDQGCRGSGRTTRMIMALPEGAVVLCFQRTEWMKQQIRDLRGPKFKVTLIACTAMGGFYDGINEAKKRKAPVAADHHLIREMYLQQIRDFTRVLASFGMDEHNHSLATDQPPPARMFNQF